MKAKFTALTAATVVLGGLAVVGGIGATATGATAAAAMPRAGSPAAASLGPGGIWGAAQPLSDVPAKGVADPGVPAMSCTAPGNCSLIGYYSEGSVFGQGAFFAREIAGVWHHAQAIPGLAALDGDRAVGRLSISCATPGNCAAGGYYTAIAHGTAEQHAFVVNQVEGVWGNAQPLDTSALGGTAGSWLYSISCGSPGNCSAAGVYFTTTQQNGAFVVTEANGSWGAPQAVPGLAAILPASQGDSVLTSVSCPAKGDCSAMGLYPTDANGGQSVFAVDEENGTWGDAQPIPGLTTLAPHFASDPDVSCSAIGECTVAGSYGAGLEILPFTATETNGTWGNATELQGVPALDTGGIADVALSCPATGSCALAVDYYQNTPFDSPIGAFVAMEQNGTWGNPQAIRGLPNSGVNVAVHVNALSCPAAGNCAIGGYYDNVAKLPNGPTAFVAAEINGTWGGAHRVVVPSIGSDAGQVTAVSCGAVGYCSASVFNNRLVGGPQVQAVFVVNEATASATGLALSTAKLTYGHENAEHFTITVTGWRSLTPTGTVTVNAGNATICAVTLRDGKGSCTLTAARLKPGTYSLTARYVGSVGYLSSTSPAKTLKIAR